MALVSVSVSAYLPLLLLAVSQALLLSESALEPESVSEVVELKPLRFPPELSELLLFAPMAESLFCRNDLAAVTRRLLRRTV